jgi:dipeptidyl aminopeptidase/acylaminoacyl peptidase
VSEEEARAVVGVTALSGSPPENREPRSAADDRYRFYLYCRQQGCWPQAATGFDPHEQLDAVSPFCPVRHVTADFPPTLLLHGDEDTDVPYEQSVMMASALAAVGVPHRLLTIAGGEHGFDSRVGAPDVVAAFAEVLEFLALRLRAAPPTVGREPRSA